MKRLCLGDSLNTNPNSSVGGRNARSKVRLATITLAMAAMLSACGGGGGSGDAGGTIAAGLSIDPIVVPQTRAEAQRFLVQSTFGPNDADTDRVMALGYKSWIEEQFTRPQASHRAYWDASNTEATRAAAAVTAGPREVFDSFYINAINGNDQLRQRVAFALSEILVISMVDGSVGENPRGVAGYLDTLGANAFGNYRDLLEAVALHPMMGIYLTHIKNQKEDPAKGRIPDQNFAREILQLFTIGVLQLNSDASVKTDSAGKALETYTGADVGGLSRVFTGFSWSGPDTSDSRFFGGGSPVDVNRTWTAMQPYAKYHSTSEKAFLGQSIAAGGTATTDLKAALDTIFMHPNVGPFIGKQLIQRLVTSNPSPAYITRVAAAFADNGAGVRGDMKAVLRAILLDSEARNPASMTAANFGKLKEPVLRMTGFLRAFNATSDSGRFLIGTTDDPGSQLGQSPMRAPTVFNFFRPGYQAPDSKTAGVGLAAPEMQITHETTVVGYANFMRNAVQSGIGQNGLDGKATRRDVQANYAPALAVADDPAKLVDLVMSKLVPDAAPDFKTEIQQAVESVTLPALKADASNQTAIDNARKNRVYIATYLTVVSPEFLVQK
ncbi:DUF1800 domain-containing protein [soil metagenome]